MFRVRRLTFVVVFAFLLGAVGFPPSVTTIGTETLYGSQEALAQTTKKKRRSLFNILFGRKKAKKKAVVKNRKRKSRSKKTRTTKKSSKNTAKTAKAVSKLDNAKVILVVGDFLAGGMADGLTTALAKVPGLRVVDKSKGLSGFVRDDIVDWSTVLPALVRQHRPAYIIAQLGSNDRQQIRSGGRRLKKQTPAWFTAYDKRVKRLGEALKASQVHYAWMGLPPVRFKSMNKDFLRFNELYGKAAASPKGQFIDVWDGFSDADGNYSRSGPDINGQIVLLRSKDGINLTRAGKRRMAYYVEGRILKLFAADLGVAGLAGSGIDLDSYPVQSPQYDPAKTGKTVVVRLDDPAADGGDALAGEVVEASTGLIPIIPLEKDGKSALVSKHAGRVDNYAWPPRDDVTVTPIAIAQPALRGTLNAQQSAAAESARPVTEALQN